MVIEGFAGWIMVRIYTDEGITGTGESYWGIGVREVIELLKPRLIGRDPTNVERLYQDLYRGLAACGGLAGVAVTAISGIEIALWDIAGKALNAPVYKLLGGKYRDRIRLYADCGVPGPRPEDFAAKAQEIRDRGFTAVKFDLDRTSPREWQMDPYNRCLSPREVRHLLSLAEGAREGVGDDLDLLIDLHWAYTPNAALQLAKGMEELGLLWLEDPIPPENVDALARLTDATSTPICTGENLYTRHGFRELIEKQAANILAPDIPKVGGLFESRKIADMADTYYLVLGPHNVSSPLGTMAAAHVCAAIPNFLVLEYHFEDLPWWDDLIVGDGPVIRDGFIDLPEKPGLGVELNEDAVRAHLRAGEVLFE